MPKSDSLIAESIKLIIVSLVIDFHHILSEERRQRQSLPPYVFSALFMSVEEIVLIVRCSKVILCPGLTSERFAVTDLLKVVQSAGDSAVAVGVESVEVDGSPAVNAGVDFGTFQDRLSVSVHNAGSGCAVGVDEVAVLVSLIVRSFQIAVAERGLDSGKGGNRLAVALQLALSLLISCWMAALIFSTVAVSDFGMMRETLYLGVPPLMDFGSQTLAYDHLVLTPVITFVAFINLGMILSSLIFEIIFCRIDCRAFV